MKMNNTLKLVLNCFIGAAITSSIYGSFVLVAAASPVGEPEALLGFAFLIVMPVSLFFGSFVTGRMSAKQIKSFIGCILLSPGFYLAILFVMTNFAFATMEFAIDMLLPSAIWIGVSLTGVWLGATKSNKKEISLHF